MHYLPTLPIEKQNPLFLDQLPGFNPTMPYRMRIEIKHFDTIIRRRDGKDLRITQAVFGEGEFEQKVFCHLSLAARPSPEGDLALTGTIREGNKFTVEYYRDCTAILNHKQRDGYIFC